MFLFFLLFYSAFSEFDKLIFEENFDTGNLNSSKWEYDLGNGIYGWGNQELQYYRKNSENLFIENNQLHIRAKAEKFGEFDYTSAKILTKNTFHFTYGYVEARIKLPKGKGIWPGFWMLGANIDEVNWPNCGEIDILEAINDDDNIHHYLHFNGEYQKDNKKFGLNINIEKRDEFHIYGLKWTKDEIVMYVDNIENLKIKLSDTETDAFNKPFYLLLNVAIGGEFPGFDIDDKKLPLEMIIDYIHIYQENENCNYFEKKLVWEDNFNGEKLDISKWSYQIGNGGWGWGTGQKQYYTNSTSNIFLENSTLHIKAKLENYKTYSYTSGRIHTQDTFQFTYGIIELKILFPSVNGVSPGFFLATNYRSNILEFNEIDALIGRDGNNILSSGCIWGNGASYFKELQYDIKKFNIYTIIWDKKYITIYLDDLEIYKIDITSEGLKVFHYPFYLNLDVLVGGETVFEDIDINSFPAEMLVDYIKIYQYNTNFTIYKKLIDNEEHQKENNTIINNTNINEINNNTDYINYNDKTYSASNDNISEYNSSSDIGKEEKEKEIENNSYYLTSKDIEKEEMNDINYSYEYLFETNKDKKENEMNSVIENNFSDNSYIIDDYADRNEMKEKEKLEYSSNNIEHFVERDNNSSFNEDIKFEESNENFSTNETDFFENFKNENISYIYDENAISTNNIILKNNINEIIDSDKNMDDTFLNNKEMNDKIELMNKTLEILITESTNSLNFNQNNSTFQTENINESNYKDDTNIETTDNEQIINYNYYVSDSDSDRNTEIDMEKEEDDNKHSNNNISYFIKLNNIFIIFMFIFFES